MGEAIRKPKSFGDTAKGIARRIFRNENAVLIIVLIALIGVMGVITKGLSVHRANLMNVLLQSSIRGVASVGQTFVLLSAGIDLSVGGIGLFSAVLGAAMMTKMMHLNIVGQPIPMYMGIPIMLAAGTAIGTANGLSASRIRMPALIVTLAMWEILKGAAFLVCGGRSITDQPDSLAFFGSGTVAGIPIPIIIFVATAILGYFVLNYTSFGRSVYAVGGNPISAWLSGINVRNIQSIVYIISGFLAALAGVIMTARTMSASMRTVAGLELDSIAAVCIGGVSLMGGKGSLIGVVIGVLILGVINNAMSILGADPATQGIAKGAIIFTAVAIDYLRRR